MCRWSETPDHRLQWEICQISSGWCALEFVLRSFSWNGRWSPLVWGEWRLFHLGQVSWVHGKATFICYILSSSNMGENIGVTVLREADGQLALSWNEGGQQSPVVLLHQGRHYDLLVPLPSVAARKRLRGKTTDETTCKDSAGTTWGKKMRPLPRPPVVLRPYHGGGGACRAGSREHIYIMIMW